MTADSVKPAGSSALIERRYSGFFVDPPKCLRLDSPRDSVEELKMKKTLVWVVFAAFALSGTCVDVWAQATAQITGTVRDQSRAVLPGVEVTATQTETGIARSTVTNETGTFVLSNLAIGPYKVDRKSVV